MQFDAAGCFTGGLGQGPTWMSQCWQDSSNAGRAAGTENVAQGTGNSSLLLNIPQGACQAEDWGVKGVHLVVSGSTSQSPGLESEVPGLSAVHSCLVSSRRNQQEGDSPGCFWFQQDSGNASRAKCFWNL